MRVLLLCGLCLLLLSGCSAPYFANAARDFGTVMTSPAADVGPFLYGIGALCRRQADLAYLRNRLEEPDDKHLVPWSGRHSALYHGRKVGIEARCAELDHQITQYIDMYSALRSYGQALRALGDSEGVDFRESFYRMGSALGDLSYQLYPAEPDLSQVMREGADAVNKLVRMALNARTERDLKKAIRAAALPAGKLLTRLGRVKDVYEDQVQFYTLATQALLARAERASTPPGAGPVGRTVSLIEFYQLAQRTDEELDHLAQSSRAAAVTLDTLRRAHDKMVEAANNRIPAKEAFASVRQIFMDLAASLQGFPTPVQGYFP